MPIRNILVPLDGSDLSERALGFATALARPLKASIHILSVVPDPFILAPGTVPGPLVEEITRAHEGIEKYVADVVGRLRSTTGLPVTGEVALGGPADSILDTVRRAHADVVVMTSHGRGGFTRFWLGSVANTLVRRATVPVLVLKPDGPEAERRRSPRIYGVLVPLDGSPSAEIALQPAMALATAFDAPIKLLLVLENPLNLTPGFAPYGVQFEPVVPFEQKEHAERYLSGVANRIRKLGFFVDAAISDEIGVANAIVEHERESVHGVIVMATNARGGWKRFVMGSVADKVVRQAECPVLLVRPAEAPPRFSLDRHPEWKQELIAFSRRNAARPVRIEVDVPSLGAQREVEGLELSGVYYDPRDDRFGVTVRGRDGTHLSHAVDAPTRIDILDQRGTEILAVAHDGGQTLVRCSAVGSSVQPLVMRYRAVATR